MDWDPALYLIIDDKIIGFQGRHKDKLRVTFKYAGDGFQADDFCDRGYTLSFIYRSDDIHDLKHYLCATSERVIWILNVLRYIGTMCTWIVYTTLSGYAGLHMRKRNCCMVCLGHINEVYQSKLFSMK